jgi:hypothetical protein
MDKKYIKNISSFLDHGDPDAVYRFWHDWVLQLFPQDNFSLLDRSFPLVRNLFEGEFPGYLACRTNYHDYQHTIDVFVATVRLADGCLLSGLTLSAASVESILLAALFHDVGYIQEVEDPMGTGAKYTATHVRRSVDFLSREGSQFSIPPERCEQIGRLILGTDLSIPWDTLSVKDEEERLSTEILAAADLLGQMADRSYLEKLLFLYYEFKEAGVGGYESAFDILRKTAGFYGVIKNRLETTLQRVSHRAIHHFLRRTGENRDFYWESIVNQMQYLDSILDDDSQNFRKRLRRIDLESAELKEKARLASFGVHVAYDSP